MSHYEWPIFVCELTFQLKRRVLCFIVECFEHFVSLSFVCFDCKLGGEENVWKVLGLSLHYATLLCFDNDLVLMEIRANFSAWQIFYRIIWSIFHFIHFGNIALFMNMTANFYHFRIQRASDFVFATEKKK